MRSFLAAILVTATALTAAAPSSADDGATTPKNDSEPEQTWYGLQTLSTDGAALALAIASAASTRSPDAASALAWTSLAAYVLGGPFVHLVHERVGTAAGDLVMRLSVPVASAVLGGLVGGALVPASSSSCEGDGPCGGALPGAVLGLGAGVFTAVIVDATVMAYEPAKPDDAAARDRASRLRIVPNVAFVPQQGREAGIETVGASGTF